MDEEKYLADLKLMFATDGWKVFVANVTDELEMLNNVASIKNSDEMFYRKGQIAVLSSILNYESQLEAVYNESAE